MLPEVVKYLIKAGHQAPSPDNSQPWNFSWNNKALSLCYDEKRGTSGFAAQHPATLLTMGAVMENLIQAATAIDLPVNWEIPEQFSKDGLYLRAHFDPSVLPPSEAWNHAVFSRHTNRLGYKTDPLPEQLLNEIESQQQDTAAVSVRSDVDSIRKISSLVKTASQVRFQTREIHEWLINSLRFTAAEVERGDGLDLATLDLPPGGRFVMRFISDWKCMAFLNRLGAYKFFAAMEAQQIKSAPAIIAITGADDYFGGLQAGRLMERVWLVFNAKGVAVHPYFVLPDQLFRSNQGAVSANLVKQVEDLYKPASEFFGLGENILYMLLRVGYPAHKPILSRRLALQQIYHVVEA